MTTREKTDLLFFADVMLGRLAKWLRIVGYDTAYELHIEDDALLTICQKEGRILLTRHRKLFMRDSPVNIFYVPSTKPLEQFWQVVKEFSLDLTEEKFFTRCTWCNEKLIAIDKKLLHDKIPPYVENTEVDFRKCNNCDKIYWQGTHKKRFQKLIFGEDMKYE